MYFLISYLNTYVNNIFAGAWEKRELKPLPVNQPMASDDQGILFLKYFQYHSYHLFI